MRTVEDSVEMVRFSHKVLDDFRKNVGKYYPETGGLIGSTDDERVIDLCYFDRFSHNEAAVFKYDVETMSEVYRSWKAKGYKTNGIYHSHPLGATRPSYYDIATAKKHMDFFGHDYFYLPIFQTKKNGNYEMYFYIVKKDDEKKLAVNLEYILKAKKNGYECIDGRWNSDYGIDEIDRFNTSEAKRKKNTYVPKEEKRSTDEYFVKINGLFPKKVQDKVIVCVGTGGSRSFLENFARMGFRNFILIDGDVVSSSNIATQAVFISEMGKKKVDVIKDRILDINPDANVLAVDRYLDDDMSDNDFNKILRSFKGKMEKDYLILGCTDNFAAQSRSALLALKYKMPYMAAAMYKNGLAAEVIFVYPGVTPCCPRCLLRRRYELYEEGFVNDVDSSMCPIFATERMNACKGYVAIMMLMYGEDDDNPYSIMLDEVKDRNFVQIRLSPFVAESDLSIGLFDKAFSGAERYTFMDETIWVPQHPDSPKYGEKKCKLCKGIEDLRRMSGKLAKKDTRKMIMAEG